jgi:hypothetical protein
MKTGGVLLFSRAFTNDAIAAADPIVMSNFGLQMMAVWGLAYLGAATASTGIRLHPKSVNRAGDWARRS